MISSKNKKIKCPACSNCKFLMPLFNPVANNPDNIIGRFYFLRRKNFKVNLTKKRTVLSLLKIILQFPALKILFLKPPHICNIVRRETI